LIRTGRAERSSSESRGLSSAHRIWRALPRLFPEAFGGRDDYSTFGFLYENDAQGRQRDLPIGIARRVPLLGSAPIDEYLKCSTMSAGRAVL
jgi:hypothetical protein